ncbi:MAG TPA: hypothetical protein DCM05_02770 [Elusimicrobia bacterium]|nr:hypothetical protein [Elusimicrobiota bacterium]
METLQAAVVLPFIVLFSTLSMLGHITANVPLVGIFLFALLGAIAYGGIRLSRTPGRSPLLRRLLLIAGVCAAAFGLAAIPFVFIGVSSARFEDWHSSGAGLQPGMTLADARAALARKGPVTELSMDGPEGSTGVRFQVEPIGLAKYHFGFFLHDLYYIGLKVDASGKIVTVEAWSD